MHIHTAVGSERSVRITQPYIRKLAGLVSPVVFVHWINARAVVRCIAACIGIGDGCLGQML